MYWFINNLHYHICLYLHVCCSDDVEMNDMRRINRPKMEI